MNLFIPDPEPGEFRAAVEWWRSLNPRTRLTFFHAVWQMEGCEAPRDIEDHQRNPRYRPVREAYHDTH
jgi:hypothetical protein